MNYKKNYYDILGLAPGASIEEIRRAYRILARRYHPDVNPGSESTEKFRAIAEAYEFLSDAQKKVSLDEIYSAQARSAFAEKIRAYEEAQKRAKDFQRTATGSKKQSQPKQKTSTPKNKKSFTKVARAWFDDTYAKAKRYLKRARAPRSVSLLELPLTIAEAIYGGKKVVDIPESAKKVKKISVKIPRGTRPGEILRLRRKDEELIFIVKILPHKKICIEPRGAVLQLELSVSEAVLGGSIVVPTPDGEVSLHIPAKTKSGTEFKLKDKGIIERDGARGDFYVRVTIQLPEDTAALTQQFPSPLGRPATGSTFESLLSCN